MSCPLSRSISSVSFWTTSSCFLASSARTKFLLTSLRSSASIRASLCFRLFSCSSKSPFSFSAASSAVSSSELFFCASIKSLSALSFSSWACLISSSSSASFLFASITSSLSSFFSSSSMLFWMLSCWTSWSFSWMLPSRRRIVSLKSSITFCFLALSFLALSRLRCASASWVCSEAISFLSWEVLSFSASKSALNWAFALLAAISCASKFEFLAFRVSISRSSSSREFSLFSKASRSSEILFSKGARRSFRSSLSLEVIELRDSNSLILPWCPPTLERRPSTSLKLESWEDWSCTYLVLTLSNSLSNSCICARQRTSSFSNSLTRLVCLEFWLSRVATLLLVIASSRWRSSLVDLRLSITASCSAVRLSEERSSFSRSFTCFASTSARISLWERSCFSCSSWSSSAPFFCSKFRICLFFPSASSRSLSAARLLLTASFCALDNASLLFFRSSRNLSSCLLRSSRCFWEFCSCTSNFLTRRSHSFFVASKSLNALS